MLTGSIEMPCIYRALDSKAEERDVLVYVCSFARQRVCLVAPGKMQLQVTEWRKHDIPGEKQIGRDLV